MSAEYMYLKDPDWDMCIELETISPLLPLKDAHIAAMRNAEIVDMWGEAIDGEYLHVRADGELCVNGGSPVSDLQITVELPDGEYRLVFQGGYYLDDWEPWSHKYARQLQDNVSRGQIEVRLLAVVSDGVVAFSIEPPSKNDESGADDGERAFRVFEEYALRYCSAPTHGTDEG